MDTVSQERRSAIMSSVRRTGTKPELTLRKELHKLGFRYLIADKRLPGSPDLVFPKYKAVVFVHGCFWHGHDCRQGQTPATNSEFWGSKVLGNRERDARKEQALVELGWRVFTVWECELKATKRVALVSELAAALRGHDGLSLRLGS